MSLSQEKHLEIVLALAITSDYMELIYPEFLRFKDRVTVPYTELPPLQRVERIKSHISPLQALEKQITTYASVVRRR